LNTVDQMKLFMEPRSVALIGVPRRTGIAAWNIMENLLNSGYAGRMYPVNPNADEILGKKCYPSVKDIPEVADLAVISTPRSQVPKTVRECTEKGIKAITVVTQGFADADEEGKKLQEEIVRSARQGGARIMGPNTFGTSNAFCKFSSAFAPVDLQPVPIGLICQTGLFMAGIPRFPMLGKGIDLGNACDIDFADGLEYFEHDAEVKVILLHMEGTRDGARFINVAKRVSRSKPIVALKTGRAEGSAQAMQSHTGTLTGADEVYHAAFKQCGVLRVSDIDEFHDFTRAFLRVPPMKGSGVGIITIAGAGGIMAIDACEKYGLRLGKPSAETLEKIAPLAPPWQTLENPADIWPAFMIARHRLDDVFYTIADAFLADPDIHGIIIVSHAALVAGAPEVFQRARRFDKPVLCWLYGSGMEQLIDDIEGKGETAVYPNVERAIRALSRLREYQEYLSGERR
jgi:acyl-CoA synthetase (NDP forming)